MAATKFSFIFDSGKKISAIRNNRTGVVTSREDGDFLKIFMEAKKLSKKRNWASSFRAMCADFGVYRVKGALGGTYYE
jgi:hypothetical protein